MKIYRTAILPKGFLANGISCGIKKSGKPDLALFYSLSPAQACCKFTSNKIVSAPIIFNRVNLKKSAYFNAILVNSGNANCFTGKQGLSDARKTASSLASCLAIQENNILLASTGIIGRRLKAGLISKAMPRLKDGLSRERVNKAKLAILTTDTFPKAITVKVNIRGKIITLCGIAKGAGMIAPDMATMLCFILTDVKINRGLLAKAISASVDGSFNSINIDGCMSTNDSVMVLANGQAGNRKLNGGADFRIFSNAMDFVCLELAKMIVMDAEGATKFIRIDVVNARDYKDAKSAAMAIAASVLFKTAVYGESPNFGRIVSAIGSSGIDIKEKDIRIKISPLKKKNVNVTVSLGTGRSSATVYTSDLTPEYIKINAGYN